MMRRGERNRRRMTGRRCPAPMFDSTASAPSEAEYCRETVRHFLHTTRCLGEIERHWLERVDCRNVLRSRNTGMQRDLNGFGLRKHALYIGRQQVINQSLAFVRMRRVGNQRGHVWHDWNAEPIAVGQHYPDRLSVLDCYVHIVGVGE